MSRRAPSIEPLRVALVAGTLGDGGAEKQLVMMVDALKQAHVDVRVYCATQGEHYESTLRERGCDPVWFGKHQSPIHRVYKLSWLLRRFRPHLVQSAHFYTNLYVALASKMLRTVHFGAIRNDAIHEVEENGRWGRPSIRMPSNLIANSNAAKENALQYGVLASRIHVLPNVIDVADFDQKSALTQPLEPKPTLSPPTAIVVGRLVHAKRIDRFLDALVIANKTMRICGVIVGDGKLRSSLESYAQKIGLCKDTVNFVGWKEDLPSRFRHADMLVISSDHEGFPNVLLEAMAASLPAIATPAGEVPNVIQIGKTGYIVPFDDTEQMASRMVELANDKERRTQMGSAARRLIETTYSSEALAAHLFAIYHKALGPPQRSASIEQFVGWESCPRN